MNVVYRALILSRAQAAVGAARAVKGISHSGLKGRLREIVIRDLLRPLLPSDVGLGTGQIITAINQYSQEQDVVLFDRSILPPILHEGTTGIFPIESVLFAIEVKSTLTAERLKSSNESANQLRSLEYFPGEFDDSGKPIQLSTKRLIPAILAFDSDLSETGKTELERFKEIWGGSTDEPPIQMLCVVGRGLSTWKPEEPTIWRTWESTYLLEEAVTFMAFIMNSYKALALSRKAPRLGHYLLRPHQKCAVTSVK
jgi:hypothetical protein